MKVLITGCSSSQTTDSRMPTFSGLIKNALIAGGHDVVLDTPSIRWSEEDLSRYDSVIVGLAPPTSISAYRLYGALSVIDVARKVTNVRYLVDAPEPHRLWNGIRAIASNPESLIKDFYSKRPDYLIASEPKQLDRLHSVVVDLFTETWEKTLIPAFPWSNPKHITNYIPMLTDNLVSPLCLDSFIIDNKSTSLYIKNDSNMWSYDSKNKWLDGVAETISGDVQPITVGRKPLVSDSLNRINRSVGTIISTYKNNDPWWSINLPLSLSINTPVITDWRYTSQMGDSWSLLAHQIEELSVNERSRLAAEQTKDYKNFIPNKEEVINSVLESVIDK